MSSERLEAATCTTVPEPITSVHNEKIGAAEHDKQSYKDGCSTTTYVRILYVQGSLLFVLIRGPIYFCL